MTTTDPADDAFRDFFRAAVPHPWPPLRAVVTPATAPARHAGRASKYALAASVAAVFGAGVYLSATTAGKPNSVPVPAPGMFDSSTADGGKILPKTPPMDGPPMPPGNAP